MFSLNKKLDPNLKTYMSFNNSRSYRVLIKYKNFQDSINNIGGFAGPCPCRNMVCRNQRLCQKYE
jgi:hypothetical protein